MDHAPRRLRRAFALLVCACGIGTAGACAAGDDGADPLATARMRMVERQIAARGIADVRVLDAMRRVPRHLFVACGDDMAAYQDRPLPIGHGQTISQPYIVALMTQLARPQPGDRVLEIGTGSGYQAAVLALLAREVRTIEIVEPLAAGAAARLRQQGHGNVTVRAGDGYGGWPDAAPFDVIVVTAAPARIPEPLLQQLKPGGRLVAPVGPAHASQELRLVEKDADGRLRTTRVTTVRFVPFTRSPAGAGAVDD